MRRDESTGPRRAWSWLKRRLPFLLVTVTPLATVPLAALLLFTAGGEHGAEALGLPENEVVQRVMLEPAAVKRLIEPEEVAELALYLASDRAGAVTGGAFTIDGGWTAR